MLTALTRSWWLFVLRGLLAVVFGILALVWPGPTVDALVLLFGIFVLIDGVVDFVQAFTGQATGPAWIELLQGLLGVGIGILTLVWPDVTELVLLAFIAAWMILIGILGLLAAVRLRRVIRGEWLLGVNGALSLVLGILLIAFPMSGAVAVAGFIGIYAILFGVLLIALGVRLLTWRRATERQDSL